MANSKSEKTKIVIIGAGFGGISAALSLKNSGAEITFIDKQNHHLFQPLLYQVAAGVLSASDIAAPIRSILGKSENLFVRMEEVQEIDRKNKVVKTHTNEYQYDYVIIATGSEYSYFGKDQWKPYTYTLKTLPGAVKLRNQIYHCLEQAIAEKDTKKREALLNFVVVGGGPTGVEMAGIIAESCEKLCQEEMKLSFDDINIHLIEGLDRVLAPFDPSLSQYALEELERKGVKVSLNSFVDDLNETMVKTKDFEIKTETIIWAAGVQGVAAPKILGLEPERGNKVVVNEFLNLADDESVFVIGDCATSFQDEKALPSLGSVANQQGKYLGKEIKKIMAGKERKAFVYKDLGTMATIGRDSAIAEIFGIRIRGFLAWVLWGAVHIALLVDFRNRTGVMVSWIWAYLLNNIGSRNITLKFSKEKSFLD